MRSHTYIKIVYIHLVTWVAEASVLYPYKSSCYKFIPWLFSVRNCDLGLIWLKNKTNKKRLLPPLGEKEHNSTLFKQNYVLISILYLLQKIKITIVSWNSWVCVWMWRMWSPRFNMEYLSVTLAFSSPFSFETEFLSQPVTHCLSRLAGQHSPLVHLPWEIHLPRVKLYRTLFAST